LRPFGFIVAGLARPIQARLQAVKRSYRPERRRVLSRLRRPVGRAVARAVAYPLRIVLQSRGRQLKRLRYIVHRFLRRPGGVSGAPARDIGLYVGQPISGWVTDLPVSGWIELPPQSGWVTGKPENEE
jgi:hypothetical protein